MNLNSRIRIFLVAVLSICNAWPAVSQPANDARRLSFEIRDAADRHPLNNVTCRVFTAEGKLYTYGISDSEGRLTVSVREGDFLEFSAMGYGRQKVEAASCPTAGTSVIELAEQAVELREVTAKAPPVSARNDTIAYNIASFATPGDRHLEDVLKKLPGIKVSENGTVSYQGKAINKFYIEGMDLLGSSYNQATRNMPVEAVTTVEVLESHQPVRMLRGRQFSDDAALNIRIDKGHKSRPFGEVEGGAGGSPAIWDNRVFLTQIFGKSQFLVTGKMNNTGTDISDETKEHIDVTDLDAYEPLMPSVLSTKSADEALPQDRYLRNKSYSAGTNYITSLSADATLRLNLLVYKGNDSHTDCYSHTYGGTEEVSVSESNNVRQKALTILPIIKYELNANRTFVSDEFRYSFNRTSSLNTLVTNGERLSEKAHGRPSYFQNNFSSAFAAGKQVVQIKSLFRYFNRKEALDDIADSAACYNVSEAFSTRSLVAKNILSTSIPLCGNDFKVAAKIYYKNDIYDYAGEMQNRKLHLQLTPGYAIPFGEGSVLSVDLPIEWTRVRLLSDTEEGSLRSFFSFAPGIYLRHQLTSRWRLILTASMSTDNATADFYSPFAMRTGYRTEYIPDNSVYLNTSKRISARLNYRDLAAMFFSNVSFSYSDGSKECYTDYNYSDSLTTISLVAGDNRRRMLALSVTADKSLTDAGVSLKSEVGYNRSSYLISQSGILTYNKSNTARANISAIYQKLAWLRLAVGATGTLYWESNGLCNSDRLKSLVTNAAIYIFPAKTADLKLTYYNHTNEISPSRYKNCGLLDMEASLKIGKTWEAGVLLTNCLNAKSYSMTQDTGLNTFHSNLTLRGRECLFRLLLRI